MIPGVEMDVACMFVMPAVGLYGVDMTNPRMGQTVVVYGTGLIGLGVVAACAHRGCVVLAVDLNEKRLAVAKQLGADYSISGESGDVQAEVKKIAPEGPMSSLSARGFPSASIRPLRSAVNMAVLSGRGTMAVPRSPCIFFPRTVGD